LIGPYVGRDTIFSVDGIHAEPHNPFATLHLTPASFIFGVITAIKKDLATSWNRIYRPDRTCRLLRRGCCSFEPKDGVEDEAIKSKLGLQRSLLFGSAVSPEKSELTEFLSN
jgi:hypothetical protein